MSHLYTILNVVYVCMLICVSLKSVPVSRIKIALETVRLRKILDARCIYIQADKVI